MSISGKSKACFAGGGVIRVSTPSLPQGPRWGGTGEGATKFENILISCLDLQISRFHEVSRPFDISLVNGLESSEGQEGKKPPWSARPWFFW